MRKTGLALLAAAAAMAASPALAQLSVEAVTELNVRAGPGPQYEVIGVLGLGQDANLNGCLDSGSWCSVTYAGGEGWVSSQYLASVTTTERVIIAERPATLEVPTVVYESDGGGVIAGATTGAIAGAVVAGPVGAAVGGVAGAATGGLIEGASSAPPEQVRRYVFDNPVDPVYLDGEVVVGATLPDTVVYRDIPDYEYRYVSVNGQYVLVEPDTRRVVYIVR